MYIAPVPPYGDDKNSVRIIPNGAPEIKCKMSFSGRTRSREDEEAEQQNSVLSAHGCLLKSDICPLSSVV
jgi:hypothetical protein